jgi:hypothetical protein
VLLKNNGPHPAKVYRTEYRYRPYEAEDGKGSRWTFPPGSNLYESPKAQITVEFTLHRNRNGEPLRLSQIVNFDLSGNSRLGRMLSQVLGVDLRETHIFLLPIITDSDVIGKCVSVTTKSKVDQFGSFTVIDWIGIPTTKEDLVGDPDALESELAVWDDVRRREV